VVFFSVFEVSLGTRLSDLIWKVSIFFFFLNEHLQEMLLDLGMYVLTEAHLSPQFYGLENWLCFYGLMLNFG